MLSGYVPVRTPPEPLSAELRPLDPGMGVKIEFEGGLLIRPKVFARSRPPRISICPLPTGVEITIGGQQAQLTAEAGWEAPGLGYARPSSDRHRSRSFCHLRDC